MSFTTQEEGDSYCARVERLLDSGIVPEELAEKTKDITTISKAHEKFEQQGGISAADQSYWPVILKRWGLTRISEVDYGWTERQIQRCKDEWHLAPSTIRHQAGAMSRLWDWLLKRGAVATNPFKALKRGYATSDRKDIERGRRPTLAEIDALTKDLSGDMLLIFQLALETAMRMREMYTLSIDQVDLSKRTVFLNKTKNGDNRQVPLSSTAISLLRARVESGTGLLLPELSTDASSLRATTSRISIAFARAADRAGCPDLRFHDLRHEATCRLFERTTMDWLEISKITGHRDPRMLRRYANLRGSDLAARMW